MAQFDNPQRLYTWLRSQNVPHGAALGVLAGLAGEGGLSLNPASRRAGDGADGSDSVNFAQWNGPRGDNLRKTAASIGADPMTWDAGFKHFQNELTGAYGKGHDYSRVLNALKNTNDPQEALKIWVSQYEVPKDIPGQIKARSAFIPQYAQNIKTDGSSPTTAVASQTSQPYNPNVGPTAFAPRGALTVGNNYDQTAPGSFRAPEIQGPGEPKVIPPMYDPMGNVAVPGATEQTPMPQPTSAISMSDPSFVPMGALTAGNPDVGPGYFPSVTGADDMSSPPPVPTAPASGTEAGVAGAAGAGAGTSPDGGMSDQKKLEMYQNLIGKVGGALAGAANSFNRGPAPNPTGGVASQAITPRYTPFGLRPTMFIKGGPGLGQIPGAPRGGGYGAFTA
jgi:hypothetical protein